MRIVKVLNNSLLLVENDDGNEQILMGKGLGYNKAIGNEIETSNVEKIFVLKNDKIRNQIIELAGEIDSEYFNLSKAIIDYAEQKYNLVLAEYIFLTLTDHLSFTLTRIKQGLVINNDYTSVVRQYNPNEYDIGVFAKNLILESMQIEIPDDEIAYIASHFINAQDFSMDINGKKKHRLLVEKVISIVEESLTIKLYSESFVYARFLLHLQSFSSRVLDRENDLYDVKEADDLLDMLRIEYPEEAKCVDRINNYIKREYNTYISNSEKLYLFIHIGKQEKILEGEINDVSKRFFMGRSYCS